MRLVLSNQRVEDKVALSAQELSKLRRIISLAEKLIVSNAKLQRDRPKNGNGEASLRSRGKRVRRTGRELLQFRNMLKAQRSKGVPVADLARRHGISSAYIYMLP
jgi:hypothetical protein